MALQGDRLYIGGFFNAVNNVPRGRVAMVNKDTGALDPTFNPNADGDVRALAIAPDQSRLYVGGSFLNIAGTAQAELVAVDPITGIRQPIVFQQFVGARSSSKSTRAAHASTPPCPVSRVVATARSAWNTNTGVRLWRNEAMGDTQAIEYDARLRLLRLPRGLRRRRTAAHAPRPTRPRAPSTRTSGRRSTASSASGPSTRATTRSRSAASSRTSTVARCRVSRCCRRCTRTTRPRRPSPRTSAARPHRRPRFHSRGTPRPTTPC